MANFQMRGVNVQANWFIPTASDYNPDAWALLQAAGVNAICLNFGAYEWEGNLHINVNEDAEWANNLNNFLNIASSYGIKVYFQALGAYQWSGINGTSYPASYMMDFFGIISPGMENSGLPATTITNAKEIIAKLAGDNSLNLNFIADPRILMWITSNEMPIDDTTLYSDGTTILSWNLELCDYIRAKGGKACIAGARINGWMVDLDQIIPLIDGHVDYLNVHPYQMVTYYNGGNILAYSAWKNAFENYLTDHVMEPAVSYGYSLNQVILGEFGIWIGTGNDLGVANVTFTDANRETYYSGVFDASIACGVQNVTLFQFYSVHGAWSSDPITPTYGLITYSNGSTWEDSNLQKIVNNAYIPTSPIPNNTVVLVILAIAAVIALS